LFSFFGLRPGARLAIVSTVKSLGIQPKRTSFRSPWQNGVAERWVGNCRRDLLDHVIVLNETGSAQEYISCPPISFGEAQADFISAELPIDGDADR
jgi:transposase InsO family protein